MPVTVPLVHVDAYRLTGTVELDDLDLDTDLGRSAVVVEWGEGVAEQLTDQRLIVALRAAARRHPDRPADPDRRRLGRPAARVDRRDRTPTDPADTGAPAN